MAHAFISYLRTDLPRLQPFVASLEAASVPLWIDRQGLEPGHEWEGRIRRAINDADAFLLFISRELAARKTSYVYKEIEFALEKLKELPQGFEWFYPIRLDAGCELPSMRASDGRSISAFQILESSDSYSAAETLTRRIKAILSNPAKRSAQMTIMIRKAKIDTEMQIDGEPIGVQLPRDGTIRFSIPATSKSLRLCNKYRTEYDVTPIAHPAATGIRSASDAHDGRPSSSSFLAHLRA